MRRGWKGNEHTRVLAVKPTLPRCAGGAEDITSG